MLGHRKRRALHQSLCLVALAPALGGLTSACSAEPDVENAEEVDLALTNSGTCQDRGGTVSPDNCTWHDPPPVDNAWHNSVTETLDWEIVSINLSGTLYGYSKSTTKECVSNSDSKNVKQAEINVVVKNPFDNAYVPALARQMLTWGWGALAPQLVGWGFYGSLKQTDKASGNSWSTPSACCSLYGPTDGTCGGAGASHQESDGELEAMAEIDRHFGQPNGADAWVGGRYTRVTGGHDTSDSTTNASGSLTFSEHKHQDRTINKLGVVGGISLDIGPLCVAVTLNVDVCRRNNDDAVDHYVALPETHTNDASSESGLKWSLSATLNGARCSGNVGASPGICHQDGDDICCGIGPFGRCFPASTSGSIGNGCG